MAIRARVEGYDTRARPFKRSEGRLRATRQKLSIGARAKSCFELWLGSRVSQPRTRQGQPTSYISAQRDMMDLEGVSFGISNQNDT